MVNSTHLVRTLVLLVSALLSSAALTQTPIENYNLVDDDRLINPEEHNWLSYRGNLEGWGYSTLDQITANNVDELEPVWSFSTGVIGGHEAPPIVNDGVMFVTMNT